MSLSDKTRTALNDSRTLMLGAQILLGFQIRAPFQDGFDVLHQTEKSLEVVVLMLMVVVVGLLIAPTARHRIVERGEARVEFNHFVSHVAFVTLFPFAFAVGLNLFIAGTVFANSRWIAFASGIGGCLVALALWYGPLMIKRNNPKSPSADRLEKTPPAKKIEFVLTEARVVLPGAQALLGFQLSIVLTRAFAELPSSLKLLHGLSLLFVALATLLLVAPAAFHRIVYDGSDDPNFYRTASRFVVAGTAFLAAGLSVETYVVVAKITGNSIISQALAWSAAVILFGIWHVWPALIRVTSAAPGSTGKLGGGSQ